MSTSRTQRSKDALTRALRFRRQPVETDGPALEDLVPPIPEIGPQPEWDGEAPWAEEAIGAAETPKGLQGALAVLRRGYRESPELWKGFGYTIVLAPGQVGTMGSLLVGLDPTGAPFGVWQAGEHVGAGIANEPGGFVWEDLRSPDPDRAASFYSGVFGWDARPMSEGGADYRLFSLAGTEVPLGGMGGMAGHDDVPPHWLVYFAVADFDAATAAAEAGGGRVLGRRVDTPYGRMAAVTDPAGAVFWLIETDGTGTPDRSDAAN